MRDITKSVVRAFLDGKARSIKNTTTDGQVLYLFGNMIAWRPYSEAGNAICMSLAGWNTPTTRERLNGLCDMLFHQRPFHQRKHEPYFAGVQIDAFDELVWYPGITDAQQMLAVNMMIEKHEPVRVAA